MIALSAVVMVAMLAMLALVTDAGQFLQARGELQNAADAAVLAGVAFMPEDAGSARSVAASYAATNAGRIADRLCDRPSQHRTTTGTLPFDGGSLHTLSLRASCVVPYRPGRALGLEGMPVAASATAARGSLQAASCPLPVGVDDRGGGAANGFGYAFGELVRLTATAAQNGNFHLLDLDGGGGGADEYRRWLANRCGPDDPRLRIGDQRSMQTQPGKLAGPTRQGLADRGLVAGNGSPYALVCPDDLSAVAPNGRLAHPESVCLGLIPVVRSWTGVHGQDQVEVLGFGLFLIAGYAHEPPDVRVDGYFVRGQVRGPLGPYTPYGTVVTRLVG